MLFQHKAAPELKKLSGWSVRWNESVHRARQ